MLVCCYEKIYTFGQTGTLSQTSVHNAVPSKFSQNHTRTDEGPGPVVGGAHVLRLAGGGGGGVGKAEVRVDDIVIGPPGLVLRQPRAETHVPGGRHQVADGHFLSLSISGLGCRV